ncbi:jg5775 [Pararge aegeria aegeria]|uniref:Jg5775 protein n=1 Tax=Pararge aegeria aegeria TaxID=348720 RepID=A0A8S4SFV0_9NEOP|nr:jg5775 [Pararge aegeria aegeria]
MKVVFVAFLALAVSANAFPQDYELENREPRIVENTIRRAFEAVSREIRERGWDPAQIINYELRTTIQPGVEVWVQIKDSEMHGISNFDVGRVNYNAVTGRLTIDFGLPRVSVMIGSAAAQVNHHGDKYDGVLSGTFLLTNLRVIVDARVTIGITGINFRSLSIDFRHGRIQSNLRLTVQGVDHSNTLNEFLNVVLPRWFLENKQAIDKALSDFFLELIRRILD